MCEYCKGIKTENNYKLLSTSLSKNNKLGFAGKFYTDIYMCKNDKNKPSLKIEIRICNPVIDRSKVDIPINIDINYCPICGRKLTDIVASQ